MFKVWLMIMKHPCMPGLNANVFRRYDQRIMIMKKDLWAV